MLHGDILLTRMVERQSVVYMATLPLDAKVQFMTVMATRVPHIRRG